MTSAYKTGRATTAFLLAGVLVALAGCSSEPEQIAVEGTAKADKLTQCVEPTDVMRRNHMEFIDHQRDETVRKGVRETNHSLAGCVECHVRYDAGGQPVAVDAPGQFCADCHEFTGTSLTCFQCHAAVPSTGKQNYAGHAEGMNWAPASTLAMMDEVRADGLHVVEQKGN